MVLVQVAGECAKRAELVEWNEFGLVGEQGQIGHGWYDGHEPERVGRLEVVDWLFGGVFIHPEKR